MGQKIEEKNEVGKPTSALSFSFIALGAASFIFSTYVGEWLYKYLFG
jgi:hypothetical protein